MNQVGWGASALLHPHFEGLPLLLVRFIRGPQKDGPMIDLDDAGTIITRMFGRASRCTYGGLKLVDPTELKNEIKAVTGEDVSTAEARAFVQCLGTLHIVQPVCEHGHLPARFTGPINFQFQGTDQQCPACGARVLDSESGEFLLVWPQKRLGHQAEREVDGGDGQLPRKASRP